MAGSVGVESGRVGISSYPRRRVALAVALVVVGLLSASAASADAYVNPFKQGSWSPGRIDMGVDMIPNHTSPVLAIGAAKILGSTNRSGWPGGRYLWYQLLSGSHKGEIVYVAENLRQLKPAGKRVKAGQRIALALPSYPYLETGWAEEDGSTRASRCYKEGDATHSGATFGRFLYRVGLPHILDIAAKGSSHPTGKRC